MAKHEHSRYAAGAISATTLGHLLGEASGARAQGGDDLNLEQAP